MNLREQLRWGGLWIILTSLLMNGMNIVVYLGYHNAAIQAVYAIGFTGLILSCTIIHTAQARQAGLFGVLAYLISLFSLALSNVVTFLTLAELAGIREAHQASLGIWHPVMRTAVYGIFLGVTLLGVSVAITGVLPRWGGILLALGVSLQLPAQYAMEIAGQLFFLFTIGGSILYGAGLIWIGWALWSGRGWNQADLGLSNLDRAWGGPVVILTALLLTVSAYLNSLGKLTLAGGVTNMLGFLFLIPGIAILHTTQADRAGGLGLAGFFLTYLGAVLYIIPAYFMMAQLAGQIANNRVLMVSWVDLPVGRYGFYMILSGIFLFGISVIRAGVFPRWTGWLVAVGLAILLPSQFTPQAYLFLIFWMIGATLQGIGLGWMGWTLLRIQRIDTRYRDHEISPI
jgi:hypothetical protein